ncbi:helix-turn-helix domain-containing protein [Blautia producta]|uniref:helix-turn-helix domain-containing protein n=1 Tax=Blautia producta TaxID=33035 RepID=UPI003566AC11
MLESLENREKKTYEVSDIQEILGVSRTQAYKYIKDVYKAQSPFKIIKVGNVYRIPKRPFDRWLNGD